MVQLAFLTVCDDLSTCFHIYLNNQHDCRRGNVGYHNPFEFAETPKMDAMVQTGVELDRHYSYPVCTPARASIQSGRVPIHVQMDNSGPRFFNPLDTIHGYQVCSPDMAVIMHSLVFTRHSLVSVLFTSYHILTSSRIFLHAACQTRCFGLLESCVCVCVCVTL
jgi:hypothetical protein